MQKQKKKINNVNVVVVSLLCLAAGAAIAFVLLSGYTLEGKWEQVDMRPTLDSFEHMPAAQRRAHEIYIAERFLVEKITIEFFNDGTAVRNITNTNDSTIFTWYTENGLLTTSESVAWGTLNVTMSYSISGSTMILINDDEGIVREFIRVEE